MTFDSTDQRILSLLRGNARLGFSALGREIGLSRTAVQERVTKLERQGVIRGYYTEIESQTAQTVQAMILVKIAERPCDPALNWLRELPGVTAVTSVSGEIDAVVACALPSPQEISALNDTIGASAMITSSMTHMVLKQLG